MNFDIALDQSMEDGKAESTQKLKLEIEQKIVELREAMYTITEQGPNGERVTINLEQELRDAKAWYAEHNLMEITASLPERIQLTVEAVNRIREAMREGYDGLMVMPALEVSDSLIGTMIEECAIKPVEGLSEEDQYTKPWIGGESERDILSSQTINRPINTGYVLLYKKSGVEPETRGKKFPECEALFKKKGVLGWTLAEWLILQRKSCEEQKNHDGFAYSNIASESNWTWLVDFRVPSGCVVAYWSPDDRQVNVDWDGVRSSIGRLGARSAVVVPFGI